MTMIATKLEIATVETDEYSVLEQSCKFQLLKTKKTILSRR